MKNWVKMCYISHNTRYLKWNVREIYKKVKLRQWHRWLRDTVLLNFGELGHIYKVRCTDIRVMQASVAKPREQTRFTWTAVPSHVLFVFILCSPPTSIGKRRRSLHNSASRRVCPPSANPCVTWLAEPCARCDWTECWEAGQYITLTRVHFKSGTWIDPV